MGRFILIRFMYMVITLWVIATVTFFLMHHLPGSPLANEERIPPELKEQILAQYGLDKPLPVQYLDYLGKLVQGDLGTSFKYDGRSVTEMIQQGFPASAQIGLQAMVFGVLLGVILGCISALRRGTLVDNGATVLSVLGYAIPSFTLAALFSYYVGVVWRVLPAAGWGTFAHSVLPSLALSFLVIAQITRYVRTEMLEVLGQDYMKTARAKGLERRVIIIRHALRNALIPAITIIGPLTVALMTGSLVVEKIFNIPGMGWMFVDSIITNDYTMIMGVTMFYSFLLILSIFIVDILYGVVDPRIRLTGAKE
ncbi:oligopeptide transport system permease protein [Melghirimyces profundicolus]|uniref:Oligopeptide transport system permease protein n=1 Tax=Melghirimyces profundicolus TaxID=1242148 RepID=A0A2T6BSS9_9BACL|nr:ABC transporter permease [Melghirimyces profundicolus]PTX59122.1 oligopeptide transport system permease protein [Melghirimyces profundicolus]